MATLNIDKNTEDRFYRYKMPSLVAKIEGRGNGIKTVVVNMSDIAKALRVEAAYPTKFLGFEVGAQVILDDKNNRYIINGAHEKSKLQELLFLFIDKYLLCPSCRNPETHLEPHGKKQKIKIICRACGKQSELDHQHRFNSYIINHPPQIKANAETKAAAPEIVEDFLSPNMEKTTEWFSDAAVEAMDKKFSSLNTQDSQITVTPIVTDSSENKIVKFSDFIKAHVHDFNNETPQIIFEESKNLDIGRRAIFALSDAFLVKGSCLTLLRKYKDVFLKFCTSMENQMMLINSFEILIVEDRLPVEDMIKMIKMSYDLDVLEEDAILKWSEKRSNRYLRDSNLLKKVHDSVKPLIDWLKTAEVETDEEESSEEEVQNGQKETEEDDDDDDDFIEHVNLENKWKYGPVKVNQDDDDLNIDDI